MSKETSRKEIELEEVRSMIYIPKNSVEITLTAKVFVKGGELIDVEKVLDMDDIRKATDDADKNYIDDDDKFVVTEAGLKWLEERTND